jgi:hypothetical protein
MKLRWIVVEDTKDFLGHWLLPLGSGKSAAHLHLSQQNPDDAASWSVEYVGHVLKSPLVGRTTLALALTYDRARQFAEAFALSGAAEQRTLIESGAAWRKAPMSDVQRANLQRVGIEPTDDMTAGEASDLFQQKKAEELRARSIEL